MKKILVFCGLFLLVQLLTNIPVFADEVIDANGNIIKCTVETVEADFVEYKKDGNLYNFTREHSSPIFNDYIDVRVKLYQKKSIDRITGKIVLKDMWGSVIQTEKGQIDIPFYRIKHVGVYKPSQNL